LLDNQNLVIGQKYHAPTNWEKTMELAQIEQRLKTDLREAKEELAQLEVILGEKPDLGPGTGNAGVRTWEMNLARKERTLNQIDKLRHALERVNEGVYGTCENCKKPINPERLAILPTATLCADCAQQQESNSGLES
jgi:RNA polymerase-binding transcription factor DksA